MYQETTDRRVIRTRMKLFAALQQLLDQKSVHAISVTEITKIAGIGRASFYRHFNDIEDILKWRIQYEDRSLEPQLLKFQDKPFLDLTLFFLSSWMHRSNLLTSLIQANRMDILEQQLINDQRAVELIFKGKISNTRTPYRYKLLPDEMLESSGATGYINSILSSILSAILVRWITGGKQETPEQLTNIAMTTIKALATRFDN